MVAGRGSGEVSGSERVCALDKYEIDMLIKQEYYDATVTIHCRSYDWTKKMRCFSHDIKVDYCVQLSVLT